MDSRALRLTWPAGTRIFEVDRSDVLDFKTIAFAGVTPAPDGTRVMVPADLRTDWVSALVDAGFRPDQPTAWLADAQRI